MLSLCAFASGFAGSLLTTGSAIDGPSAPLVATRVCGPMCVEKASDFKLNQGKAIDSLRHDYPRLLSHDPDLSIFATDVELYDPTGKRLTGVGQYANIFKMMRFLRSTTMSDAEVSYRLVVGDNIR